MSYVEGRPWWPTKSPNKGRKKKAKGKEEREIRSSLLILDLKDGKLTQESKKKTGRSINCMFLGRMMICRIELMGKGLNQNMIANELFISYEENVK